MDKARLRLAFRLWDFVSNFTDFGLSLHMTKPSWLFTGLGLLSTTAELVVYCLAGCELHRHRLSWLIVWVVISGVWVGTSWYRIRVMRWLVEREVSKTFTAY